MFLFFDEIQREQNMSLQIYERILEKNSMKIVFVLTNNITYTYFYIEYVNNVVNHFTMHLLTIVRDIILLNYIYTLFNEYTL